MLGKLREAQVLKSCDVTHFPEISWQIRRWVTRKPSYGHVEVRDKAGIDGISVPHAIRSTMSETLTAYGVVELLQPSLKPRN